MDCTGRSRKQRTRAPLIRGTLGFTLIVVALYSLASCTRPDPPEQVYTEVRTDIRYGNLTDAQERLLPEIEYWEERDPYWYTKLYLLLVDVRLAQGQAADALSLLNNARLRTDYHNELEVRRLTSLGNAYLKLSRYQESEEALTSAAALVPKSDPILLEIELFKSLLEIQRGKLADAESRLQTIQEQAQLQGDAYYRAAALNNLGLMRIRQYRYDEAVPWLEDARSASLRAGARRFTAAIVGNLSLCYTRLGNFDRALELRQEAMQLQEVIGDSLGLQSSWGEAGNLHFFQRQLDHAAEYYKKALDLAEEIGNVSDASKWAGNLATTYIEMEAWDQAQEFNGIARRLKQEIGDVESQAYSLLNQAAIEAGRGRLKEGELLYQQVLEETSENPALQWEAHAGMGDLYLRQNNYQEAYRHFDGAIQLIDQTRSELLRQDFRITFLSRLIRFYQRYVEVLVNQDNLERALQVVESSRAQILREGFGIEAGTWNDWTLARLKKTAHEQNLVFLSYWLSPDSSYLWAINAAEARVVPLPAEAEIQRQLERYQAALLSLRNPLQEANASGMSLFQILIEPVRDLVPAGSQVVIVPDGCLHGLNFETLPVASSGKYWIEEITAVVSPTLRIESAPFQPLSTPDQELLLVGDPLPVEPNYPRLKHAADEMESMQELFEGRVHLLARSEATAAGFKSSVPSQFPFIHFTTHAEANRVSPLDSAVILTPHGGDYKLYARDVLETELSADLVTVSACRGAGARAYAGEGLIGFAWAFLHSGAKNVIAGLWDVSDASTARLIETFYRSLREGASPPEALRSAKLELIHSPGNYRKPFYWGPFQIYVQ